MADPLLVAYSALQVIQFVGRQVERMQDGEITPDEAQAQFAEITARIEAANEAWERAGGQADAGEN